MNRSPFASLFEPLSIPVSPPTRPTPRSCPAGPPPPNKAEPKRRHGGGKPAIELAGQRFGTLVVVERAAKPATRSFSINREAWWRCRCESCGAEAVLASRHIRAGKRRCACRRAAAAEGRPVLHAGA